MPAEAAPAPPTRSAENLASLGRELQDTVGTLDGLVRRLDASHPPEEYRRIEVWDRAGDIARVAAKDLQDLIDAERGSRFPGTVEEELHHAEALIASVGSMAALICIVEGGDSDVSRWLSQNELPLNDARWTFTPSRYELTASIITLTGKLREIADGAPERWSAQAGGGHDH